MDSGEEDDNNSIPDSNLNPQEESSETSVLPQVFSYSDTQRTDLFENQNQPLIITRSTDPTQQNVDNSHELGLSPPLTQLSNDATNDLENNNLLPELAKTSSPFSHKKKIKHFKMFRDQFNMFGSARRYPSSLRNFTVMNIFGDFARAVGWKKASIPPPKPEVHFPDEIVEKAEYKEVTFSMKTGDECKRVQRQFVPTRFHRLKSKSLTLGPRGEEFRPRIVWIQDVNCCEAWCDRHMVGGKMTTPYQSDTIKGKKKKKKKYSETHIITEDLLFSITRAEHFIDPHKTLTLSEAWKATEIENAKINAFSKVSEMLLRNQSEDFRDIYQTSKCPIGKLATNIWILTYCISALLFYGEENLPSDHGFLSLMTQFAAFELTVYDEMEPLLQQSRDFYNFSQEVIRVLKLIQYTTGFEGEFSVSKPIKIGDGLDIQSLKTNENASKDKPHFDVFVAHTTTNDEPLNFIKFEDLHGHNKISALKNLLLVTESGFDRAKKQLQLLVEDIRDTAYETSEISDVLYQVGEIYDAVENLKMQPDDKDKEHYSNEISVNLTKFYASFKSFLIKSKHLMKRVMEVRDMMQLCFEYLQHADHIDVRRIATTSSNFQHLHKKNCCSGCCCKRPEVIIGKTKIKLPRYSHADFFTVYYEEALFCPVIDADSYQFKLMKNPSSSACEMHKPPAEIRFSNSDPARISNDSGDEPNMRSDSGISLKLMPEPEPVLKPILVKPINASIQTISIIEPEGEPDEPDSNF